MTRFTRPVLATRDAGPTATLQRPVARRIGTEDAPQ